MKNGICPKCNSSEVHARTNLTFKGGSYGSNSVPISFWVYAALDNYVCTRCGYVESYIADSNKLSKIKKQWTKVEPANQH
jgi:predicted nucleic-acid-binding Zn-ribbon protein